MKVVDVKTYAVANPPPHGGRSWIFVRLMTGEGIVGFGETHTYGLQPSPCATAQLVQDVGAGFVVGSDPFNIERLWRKLYHGSYAEHPGLMISVDGRCSQESGLGARWKSLSSLFC